MLCFLHRFLHPLLQLPVGASLVLSCVVLFGCGKDHNRSPILADSCQGAECEAPEMTPPEVVGGCTGSDCVQSCDARAPDLCEGACVNVQSDPKHCGACDRRCPKGSVCSDGNCQEECDGSLPDLCGDRCVDTKTDVEHCGECDVPCEDGDVCVDGVCQGSCPTTQPTECDRLCVNVWENPDHCGACGRACARGQLCSEGLCLDACSGSTPSQCGPLCRNLMTDPEACGSCENACGPDQVCSQGSCDDGCEEGEACDGECVDLKSDARHCGGCGKQCLSGAVCVGGTCAAACPQDQRQCGSSCVDLQTNSQHCGECGRVCPNGQSCQDGECVCNADDKSLCEAACVDLEFDEDNCGTCGKGCPDAQICEDGECSCPQEGFLLCGETCVDARSDEQNCGRCGKTCLDEQSCNDGLCECPAKTPDVCDGVCVDKQTDEENCGRCGNVCADRLVCERGACRTTIAEIEGTWTVACARYHSGDVRCWGDRSPPTGEKYGPGYVDNFIAGFSEPVVDLGVNGGHFCGLTQSDSMECWGWMYEFYDPSPPEGMEYSLVAIPIELPEGANPLEFKSATSLGLLLNEDGTLITWMGSEQPSVLLHSGRLPAFAEGLDGTIVDVTGSYGFGCARYSREQDARVECWGDGTIIEGKIGEPRYDLPPKVIEGLVEPDEGVDLTKSIAASTSAICVLEGAGEVACWGFNYNGMLSLDPSVHNASSTPVHVEGLPARAIEIEANNNSFCARLETGDLYCWGHAYGGGYEKISTHVPTLVLSGVTRLSTGQNYAWYALRGEEGAWYSWGSTGSTIYLGRVHGDPFAPAPCCDSF